MRGEDIERKEQRRDIMRGIEEDEQKEKQN